MEDPENVDIAPDGDIVFICTAEDGHSVRIRVLSVFITSASPVFKSMLAPGFKEGTTLANTSSVDITLPDDDPASIVLMFKAMHLRISSLPPSLNITSMKQLATVVDKYDCARPLAPMTYYWIHGRLSQSKCSIEELYELLHATFLLGQHELFGQIGSKLVLETTSAIEGTHERLARAYDALEKQRLLTVIKLADFVHCWITHISSAPGSCSKVKCDFHTRYGASFIDTLRNSGLWQLDADNLQLETKFVAMQEFRFVQLGLSRAPHDTDCRPTLEVNDHGVQHAFRQFAVKLKQDLQPICLLCFREKCAHEKNQSAFSI